ncbi:MAG: hypothetical protein V3573_06760 [Desulfovibrionaceae bacterium]
MSLVTTLAGKAFSLLPGKWLAVAVGASLLLAAGYFYVRWQRADADAVRLEARLSVVETERNLARADQDALRGVAAGLRAQLEEAQAAFAVYAAESLSDRQRLAAAINKPALPGEVVDDETSDWAVGRIDDLLLR